MTIDLFNNQSNATIDLVCIVKTGPLL